MVQGWYYLMNSELGQKKHLQVTNKKHLNEKNGKSIPSVNQDVLWMEPCVVSMSLMIMYNDCLFAYFVQLKNKVMKML